ncbi:MAG: hypothetical protein WC864_10385, partial [Ilumatobacteraceae bacterium]
PHRRHSFTFAIAISRELTDVVLSSGVINQIGFVLRVEISGRAFGLDDEALLRGFKAMIER